MNLQAVKTEKKIDLLTVLAFFVTARICCSALSNLPFFNMTFTFIYGAAFFVLFLLTCRTITRGEFFLLSTILLYTIYVVVQTLWVGRGIFYTEEFNAYIIIFLVVIYLWAKRQPPRRQQQLLILIVAALIFDYVYSILVLIQDPDASRILATAGEIEPSPYDVLNAVGGFDAVYGSISIVAILWLLQRGMQKNDKLKWVVLVTAVLAVVFVYMASYATAMLLLVVTIVLIFGSKSKVLSGFVVGAFLLILIFHEPVGAWIMQQSSNFSGSDVIRAKIYEFGEMLKTFEMAGTYAGEDGRIARMQRSWNSFLQNPLIGGYTVKGARIGGHSELLDTLGKFGLVGFTLLAAFFTMLYRELRSVIHDPAIKSCCVIIFFIWVITAILNPALYALQMMPFLLLLPLSTAYLNNTNLENGKDD